MRDMLFGKTEANSPIVDDEVSKGQVSNLVMTYVTSPARNRRRARRRAQRSISRTSKARRAPSARSKSRPPADTIFSWWARPAPASRCSRPGCRRYCRRSHRPSCSVLG